MQGKNLVREQKAAKTRIESVLKNLDLYADLEFHLIVALTTSAVDARHRQNSESLSTLQKAAHFLKNMVKIRSNGRARPLKEIFSCFKTNLEILLVL